MTKAALDIMYDSLCAALRHALSESGLGLTAALRSASGAEIAQAAKRLTCAETLTVFLWLDDIRAAEMLDALPIVTAQYVRSYAPAGRMAYLSALQTEKPEA